MEQTKMMSNKILKGKMKKLQKKAVEGSIFSKEHYELCVAHGINPGSAVAHKKDPTRGLSKHDVNVSELRDLFLSILAGNVQIPKTFEIKNPQFIRDIVVVHFSGCSGLESVGRSPSATPLCCVRNFKFTSSVIKDHAHSLLTVSMQTNVQPVAVQQDGAVESRSVGNTHGMAPYVMSEVSMRTWGFPVPMRGPGNCKKRKLADVLHSTDDSSSSEHLPEAQKQDQDQDQEQEQDDDNVEGYLGGCIKLPALSVALNSLATLQRCAVAPPIQYSSSNTPSAAVPTDELKLELEEELLVGFVQTCSTSGPDGLCCTGLGDERASTLDLRVLGLDCEMCDTSRGPELTRVSLVDYNGVVLLDTLVKPRRPVLDYKEAHSGVTAALLDPVTVRLEQVQVALLSIMSANTVLVGHSLENDLYALQLVHKCCVDTSVMFPHPLGFPHRQKLRYLAKEHLKINIQNSASNSSGVGHSSVEDARAALQLAKLKVENGALFGVKRGEEESPREPLVGRLPETVKSAFFFGSEEAGRRRRGCVGGRVQTTCSSNNAAAVDSALQHLQQVSNRACLLNDRNFTYIEVACDSKQDSSNNGGSPEAAAMIDDSAGDSKETDAGCYAYVDRIRSCLSTHSNRDVLLLVTSQASVQEVLAMQRRKRACSKAMSASSWSLQLEDSLERSKMACSLSDLELITVPASTCAEP